MFNAAWLQLLMWMYGTIHEHRRLNNHKHVLGSYKACLQIKSLWTLQRVGVVIVTVNVHLSKLSHGISIGNWRNSTPNCEDLRHRFVLALPDTMLDFGRSKINQSIAAAFKNHSKPIYRFKKKWLVLIPADAIETQLMSVLIVEFLADLFPIETAFSHGNSPQPCPQRTGPPEMRPFHWHLLKVQTIHV